MYGLTQIRKTVIQNLHRLIRLRDANPQQIQKGLASVAIDEGKRMCTITTRDQHLMQHEPQHRRATGIYLGCSPPRQAVKRISAPNRMRYQANAAKECLLT